jgi:hypothetical protein
MSLQIHGTRLGPDYDITRDVSHPPKQITNKKGKIVLAKGGYLIGLSTCSPLPPRYFIDRRSSWQILHLHPDLTSCSANIELRSPQTQRPAMTIRLLVSFDVHLSCRAVRWRVGSVRGLWEQRTSIHDYEVRNSNLPRGQQRHEPTKTYSKRTHGLDKYQSMNFLDNCNLYN